MKKLFLALCLFPALAWGASPYEQHVTNLYAPTIFYYDTETTGTTLTNSGSSGASYNMTTANTPTLNQSGVTALRGGAIQWAAASSQYASVNKNDTGSGPLDITTSNNRTWECWVFPTTITYRMFTTATAETAADNNVASLNITAAGKFAFNQFNSGAATVKYQGLGATTLTINNWYFLSATWTGSTITSTVYVNGVSDGTSSTDIGGAAPAAVQFIEQGRLIQATILYSSGKQQDCAVYGSASSSSNILDRYNFGISTGSIFTWPFLTKKPKLPDFRDGNYWDVVKKDGYLTGHFTPRTLQPQYLLTGYYPIFPNGNTRRFR